MNAVEMIQAAYRQGRGTWSGCNWPTRFGSLGLDLEGVTSTHAHRIASRWSGLGTTDPQLDNDWSARAGLAACMGMPPRHFAWEWELAATVLAAIETDARSAERQAGAAYRAVQAGDWPRALRHARRAAAIEAGYHVPRGWHRLWQAIKRAAEQGRAN